MIWDRKQYSVVIVPAAN